MRYDASVSDVFPDFYLLDTEVISRFRWRFSGWQHQPILPKGTQEGILQPWIWAIWLVVWDAAEKKAYQELPQFPEAKSTIRAEHVSWSRVYIQISCNREIWVWLELMNEKELSNLINIGSSTTKVSILAAAIKK